MTSDDPYEQGQLHAQLDQMENVPFASIGGLETRGKPIEKYPSYAPGDEKGRTDWLRGYTDMCRQMYGSDWRTCEFSWKPAIKITKDGVEPC